MAPKILGRRPDLWLTAFQAAITCAISFGLVRVTAEQLAYLLTALSAVFSLIVGQTLTPNSEVREVIAAGHEVVAAKNEELVAKDEAVKIAGVRSSSRPGESGR